MSEACSSVGQLEARAGVGLALAPLPKNEREGGIAGCYETVMRGGQHPGMIKRIRISGWRRASFMKLKIDFYSCPSHALLLIGISLASAE